MRTCSLFVIVNTKCCTVSLYITKNIYCYDLEGLPLKTDNVHIHLKTEKRYRTMIKYQTSKSLLIHTFGFVTGKIYVAIILYFQLHFVGFRQQWREKRKEKDGNVFLFLIWLIESLTVNVIPVQNHIHFHPSQNQMLKFATLSWQSNKFFRISYKSCVVTDSIVEIVLFLQRIFMEKFPQKSNSVWPAVVPLMSGGLFLVFKM